MLQERAIKRNIPLKSLQAGPIEEAAKGTARQTITVVTGISDEKTKEISKFVRQAVPKAQTQIQGAQVRVLGKSKDDLQAAIRPSRSTTSASRCSSRTTARSCPTGATPRPPCAQPSDCLSTWGDR